MGIKIKECVRARACVCVGVGKQLNKKKKTKRNTVILYGKAGSVRSESYQITSMSCLVAFFSLEIIATALIKYVCIFSCSTGGEDRRMLIRGAG